MKFSLELLYTASALGRGNAETLANLLEGRAPGMAEISGDIPGRSVWFKPYAHCCHSVEPMPIIAPINSSEYDQLRPTQMFAPTPCVA